MEEAISPHQWLVDERRRAQLRDSEPTNYLGAIRLCARAHRHVLLREEHRGRTCELGGYPSLQMTTNPKRFVPTLVTFGSDYTVPVVSLETSSSSPVTALSSCWVTQIKPGTDCPSVLQPTALRSRLRVISSPRTWGSRSSLTEARRFRLSCAERSQSLPSCLWPLGRGSDDVSPK